MKKLIFTAASVFALAAPASAQTITQGFTFAVASGSNGSTGTHFHSSTGGDFGNPAGRAEVGGYFNEGVRGLSEYNLAGLTAASSAFVTFDILVEGGLFGQTAFNGPINVFAYQGNNAEDIADYQATALFNIGTINLNTSTNNVGDVFSLDVTAAFNSFVARSSNSFGIRLESANLTQAWTFGNFRLTNNNQATGAVPEPATWGLMLAGFGIVGAGFRSRRRMVAA